VRPSVLKDLDKHDRKVGGVLVDLEQALAADKQLAELVDRLW